MKGALPKCELSLIYKRIKELAHVFADRHLELKRRFYLPLTTSFNNRLLFFLALAFSEMDVQFLNTKPIQPSYDETRNTRFP